VIETGKQRTERIAIAPNVFAVRGQPGARVLFTESNGRVTEFLLDRGMRPLAATRVQ